MTIADAVRRTRGDLSRAKFVRALYETTGHWLSAEMIQRVEDGGVQCHVSKTILALLGYDVTLAKYILPKNILQGIASVDWEKEDNGGSVDSPPM